MSHAYGQKLSPSQIVIRRDYSPHEGRFRVTNIKNNSSVEVIVQLENEYKTPGTNPARYSISLRPGKETKPDFDITCNIVRAKAAAAADEFIDIYSLKKEPDPKPNPKPVTPENNPNPAQETKPAPQPNQNPINPSVIISVPESKPGPLSKEAVISDFCNYLESKPFFSSSSIREESLKIDEHIYNLKNSKDRDEYIRKYQLKSRIKSNNDSINKYTKNIASLITEYIKRYDNKEITNKEECIDSLQEIITERLEQRTANNERLSDEVNATQTQESFDWKNLDWKLIGICAGSLLLLIILSVWFKKVNKKNKTAAKVNNVSNEVADASSAIVVRRKTTSVLRKQSLENVIGNDAYLEINCNDFCEDSAVRKMYIKNTCIKDIYNMYAEDLRNPDNPKEDGCMVLGRWVHDSNSNEYYVSLEHIVLPGDDAVFAEYELNFGGKIKLKVTEKLRKLRKDTNLQYDLTCWVHSHPGLGVFFSNSDCNVQTQLKHPTHPNFLTAIVVDILTPQQEMGIFTFKRDSTINSKADLKKMYSLEELYKWAVESDRNTFKPEDYYNTLVDAKAHVNECHGIELSNGAIIDMGMLVAENNSGLVGLIHGFSNSTGMKTENIVATVSKNEAVPDNELIGCFIMATHCSIPSIRKAISSYLGRIKFVLVYTTTDDLLTSIPVINQDICTDEKYYGEQKLEDLKIWTRRKR